MGPRSDGTAKRWDREALGPRSDGTAKRRCASVAQGVGIRYIQEFWGRSSAGRALESHSRGRGFDPHRLHLAQLGAALRQVIASKLLGAPLFRSKMMPAIANRLRRRRDGEMRSDGKLRGVWRCRSCTALGTLLAFTVLSAAAEDVPAAATEPTNSVAAKPIAVFGSATIPEGAREALVTWTYEVDGKRTESVVSPPRMRVTRMSSNVKRMMVRLPTEIFAIKIGDEDMLREFQEPILVDTDQPTVCTCAMRDDCGKGSQFRCEVEAFFRAASR